MSPEFGDSGWCSRGPNEPSTLETKVAHSWSAARLSEKPRKWVSVHKILHLLVQTSEDCAAGRAQPGRSYLVLAGSTTSGTHLPGLVGFTASLSHSEKSLTTRRGSIRRIYDLVRWPLVCRGHRRYMPQAILKLRAATDVIELAEFDIAVIGAPTPLRDRTPNLSYVESAAVTFRENSLQAQRRSSSPRPIRARPNLFIRDTILQRSVLCAGPDKQLGFSPERIDSRESRIST